MAKAGAAARRFQEWTTHLASDVQATLGMCGTQAVAPQGRRFLAGALNYILTQLDLIPDHEKAGAVDDAFVLRVSYGLAAEHAGKASTQESAQIGRMTNEEDEIREFLGDELFAKLRRYTIGLADKPHRGRTVEQILQDPKVRTTLKGELDQTLKKLKPVQALTDDEGAELEKTVKGYLSMKLK
jgi:uncharacterized membrane protein YkvA (DUF1232 family)